MQLRVLTGKKPRLSPRSKQDLVNKLQLERDEWENAHLGNYEKVYPLSGKEDDEY